MQNLLERKLRASRFNDPEDIAVMVSRFEETTKRQFGDNAAEYFLRFGTSRDNDPKVDITRGRLKLRKAEVEEAFSDVVVTITRSCSRLLAKGTAKVRTGQFTVRESLTYKNHSTFFLLGALVNQYTSSASWPNTSGIRTFR